MKTYVFEGFVCHGNGELELINNLASDNNFVSSHDLLSQPNVVFFHHFNDDGELTSGYYKIKVLRSRSIRDALMQVKIALGASLVNAYVSPRYFVFDDNIAFGKTSCRYLKRSISEYV